MHRICSFAALLLLSLPVVADFKPTTGPASPDGKATVVCDLPAELRMRNTGGIGTRGPGTGAGLCVFTSAEHACRLQNERSGFGLQKYMTTRPGGGTPSKLKAILSQYAPNAVYVQHTGGDEAFLRLALKTGRMPGVTYNGLDDHYRDRWGRPVEIAHMVNLVYLDDERAAILDNNRPDVYVWMTRQEFLARWRGTGGGWAVVFLADPPPPPLVRQ